MNVDKLIESAGKPFDVIVGKREDGSPVGFRVLGPGSDEYERAEREIQLLNVKETAARNTRTDLTTDEGAARVVDGGARRRKLLIDGCVVDWFGFTTGPDDAPLAFSRENLARVLKARPQWQARLVAAIEDEANFIGA